MNSYYFTEEHDMFRQSLRDFLKKSPSIIIEVGGHTNGLPEHDYCDNLSANRARNVAKYLEENGVPKRQLKHKGYGKRQPIASNKNLRGRQQNQRVEIKVLDTNASTSE